MLAVNGALARLLLALFEGGLGIGSQGFADVLAPRHDPVALWIICDIRLPRTLGAWPALLCRCSSAVCLCVGSKKDDDVWLFILPTSPDTLQEDP